MPVSLLWDDTPREAVREILLFSLACLDRGVPPDQVGRQADFLGWVARRARELGGAGDLLALKDDVSFAAGIFTQPGSLARWATARRLQAFRDYLHYEFELPAAERYLAELDKFLVPSGSDVWFKAERTGGGRPDSRRAPRPPFAPGLVA